MLDLQHAWAQPACLDANPLSCVCVVNRARAWPLADLPFHLYMLVVLNVMFIVGAYIIIKIRFQAAGTKAAVI